MKDDPPSASGKLIAASDLSKQHLRFLREVDMVGVGYHPGLGNPSWIESMLTKGIHFTATPLPEFGVVEVKKKSKWTLTIKKVHPDGHARVRLEE